MPKIIFKYWFYYVVSWYWATIYTYAVLDTKEEAEITLEFIEKNYG